MEAQPADRALGSLAAQGYTAFGIFPADPVGINSTVEELASSSIPSAALAGCTQDPSKVTFCLGTDVYNSAYLGTKELIEAMGGKGAIVHLAGLLVDPNTTLRVKAVETAVGETNGAVTLLQTVADTDAQEAADQKINALLGAQKDEIGGMIATGYIPSVVASSRSARSATSASSSSASTTTRSCSTRSRTASSPARWRRTPTARAISAPTRSTS